MASYMMSGGELESVDEYYDIVNSLSFVPIGNIVVLVVLIILTLLFFLGRASFNELILEYFKEQNPAMYNVTNNILATLPILHQVELLKDSDSKEAVKGQQGFVIEEGEDTYEILLPYRAVVSMKKEDVKDVQIKANS